MKKVCWFLILVLLLGCFAGCHQQPAAGAALTHAQKSEIEDAWKKAHSGKFPGWYNKESGDAGGFVCYGTDNGYTILMKNPNGGFDMLTSNDVAGYTFKMPHPFSMYAYKGGEFHDLNDAYRKGFISQDAIAAAFQAHKEYVCSAYPELATIWDYDK
ncbi:MAG: hypothetical protein J6A88_05595 [Oscillospiraceae bacterium]|nr:hypothetical protein [Oscillospiraceae bacterium]